MFYKVTILEKSDNHREMIVKADSKEAAVEMIPAAKAFLFPGEDTSKYIAFPESIHIDVMGAQVPHWRIMVIHMPSGKPVSVTYFAGTSRSPKRSKYALASR